MGGFPSYEHPSPSLTDFMATHTHLPLPDARRIAASFGRDVLSVEGIPAGSVNSNYALQCASGERLFLRIYEEQDAAGAEGEAELLDWLGTHGLPVVQPLRDPEGKALEHLGERPVALFPWRTGQSLCQAMVRPNHTHAIGAALARLHRVGGPRPRPGRFRVEDLFARCARIEQASDPELASMAPRLRGWLREVEARRSPAAFRGLCHGDLFRDNVLWSGDSLAAILDFESASDEPYTFDLAVTLLAWCYGDSLQQELAIALVQGYQTERPLPPEDRDAFHAEASLAALRFTTTRITDYAMRAHLGTVGFRDYRRFLARYETLQRLGPQGWLAFLALGGG